MSKITLLIADVNQEQAEVEGSTAEDDSSDTTSEEITDRDEL